jgi:hypothetical protein
MLISKTARANGINIDSARRERLEWVKPRRSANLPTTADFEGKAAGPAWKQPFAGWMAGNRL